MVTIRGNTNQCRARYKISFGANIGIPTGGTVGPIQLAISLDGEAGLVYHYDSNSAVEEYFNVFFSAIYVDVPKGCCYTVSVKNTTYHN